MYNFLQEQHHQKIMWQNVDELVMEVPDGIELKKLKSMRAKIQPQKKLLPWSTVSSENNRKRALNGVDDIRPANPNYGYKQNADSYSYDGMGSHKIVWQNAPMKNFHQNRLEERALAWAISIPRIRSLAG